MNNERLNKLSEEWLIEASIDDIQAKFEHGELTSKELVLMYLSRIAKFNKQGSSINAVLEVNPEALHLAEALDRERMEKGPRGKMHGIPVLIKDNIDTCDKMHTSAGSCALENSYAKKDAFIVECLRKAGAIILGKTNMTEWANFMTENMPSGYSSRGGQVLNPYGPGKFDVGGSSSGTGSAIAANFATVGVGTETSGSILSPASQNSLVGIKPTLGLVSRSGIIPISHSQDTAGPMTRTVRDAAILLNVLSAKDSSDPVTLKNPNESIDYTNYLDEYGLNGCKVGICKERFFDYLSEEKREILSNGIEVLKKLGAIIKPEVKIPSLNRKWSYDVLVYEFKSDLNAYLSHVEPTLNMRSLKDVIEFNNKNPEMMLKYGQTILIESEHTSGTLTEAAYINALEADIYYSREEGIDKLMKEEDLDVIVFPNNFGASIPAKATYPSITVPCGYTKEGEPVGITFSGLAFSEPQLIKVAYAYEQATKHRIPPKLT